MEPDVELSARGKTSPREAHGGSSHVGTRIPLGAGQAIRGCPAGRRPLDVGRNWEFLPRRAASDLSLEWILHDAVLAAEYRGYLQLGVDFVLHNQTLQHTPLVMWPCGLMRHPPTPDERAPDDSRDGTSQQDRAVPTRKTNDLVRPVGL